MNDLQGLYPGKHGVLANKLYDSKYGKLGYSYELFHYDNNTIPIWVGCYIIYGFIRMNINLLEQTI